MKPRSRFSALEDAIICQGVENGLTWGQISSQLPHRKRATCFNRYRTLQGVRKSRPHAMASPIYYHHHYTYDYHHHLPAPHWSLAPLTPSSTPMIMMDTPPMDSFRHHQQRRPSLCSSLSSPSPLASPSSLPRHDQWNQEPYTRQPSNASTSPASLYHYCSLWSPPPNSLFAIPSYNCTYYLHYYYYIHAHSLYIIITIMALIPYSLLP